MSGAKKLRKVKSGFFRFGEFGDGYLVTNLNGGYAFLSREEFDALCKGVFDTGSAKYEELKDKHILDPDLGGAIREYRLKNHHLYKAPHLHIVIPTLRCNLTCVYCHASRRDMEATGVDMTEEIAAKSVDAISLLHLPISASSSRAGNRWQIPHRQIYHRICDRENKTAQKSLSFLLVTNLTLMTKKRWRISSTTMSCCALHSTVQRNFTIKTAFSSAATGMRKQSDGSSDSTRPMPRWGAT